MAGFKLIVLLLSAAAAVALAAPKKVEASNANGLQILHLSLQKLQAFYRTSPGKGLHIVSETGSKGYVTVTTLDGVEMASVRFGTSGVLWRVMGHSFFLQNSTVSAGQSRMDAFVVPAGQDRRMEKEMKRDQIHLSAKLFRTLDTESVNETTETAFSELLSHPLLQGIFEMSKALGQEGVTGNGNPAALQFHVMALHFAKLQANIVASQPAEDNEEEEDEEEEDDEMVFLPRRIQKRATCTRPGWWGSTIREYGCARCPRGSGCTGLCGAQCNCWRWVCGDCCYHRGCYEHDVCCNNYPYSARCAFPTDLTCNGAYWCY